MSWTSKVISSSLFALTMTTVQADEMLMPIEVNLSENVVPVVEEATPPAQNNQIIAQPQKPKVAVKKEAFRPFTGKVKGRKVRLRANADMDSKIVKELQKGELLSVVEEKGDFYGVEPLSTTKAYVFRSFVIDDTVEGNHVNVRLEPNLDAPIISHLNAGDKVHGAISPVNNKWLEIEAPKNTRFYVAKEYVEYAGDPSLKVQHDKRQKAANQMLEAATILSKSEMKKDFPEIDFEKLTGSFKTITEDYKDFPAAVESAQKELATLQEEYLQKRLSYLENRAAHSAEQSDQDSPAVISVADMNDRMKMWQPLEEALYLTWANQNEDKSIDQYYQEQKLAAIPITGIIEVYQTAAKSKPGDFVIKDQNLPKACIYSTKVDLQKYVGKKVTLKCAERPNNNFAFPAYFVVDVE